MQHGPAILYQCPECEKLAYMEISKADYLDGELWWTDGQREVDFVLPRHQLKYWNCPECRTFHLVDDLIELENWSHTPPLLPEEPDADNPWLKATMMQQPGWRQYLEGIRQWGSRLDHWPDWETEIRLLAWRRYNDRFRSKLRRERDDLFDGRRFRHEMRHKMEEDHNLYVEVPRIPEMQENANNMLMWLSEHNLQKALNKADLLRWLGRYELALQLLDLIAERFASELPPRNEVPAQRHRLITRLSKERKSDLAVVG